MVAFRKYMDAVFSDIATAAGRPDLVEKLYTTDLPVDRKVEQIAKLKRLKKYGDGPLALVNSRFIGRFCDHDIIYLCVQVEGADKNAREALENDLAGYNAVLTSLDESTFLFLAHSFKPLYRLRNNFLEKESAEDIVAIAEDASYCGHGIDQAISLFNEVAIFEVSQDSIFSTCVEWSIAARVATADPNFRTSLVSQDAVKLFRELQELGNVNPENIYFALTSIHWKQAFLEIFKCIEMLYYLPWVIALKTKYGYSETALNIATQLRSEVKWRASGRDSVEGLFELLDDLFVKNEELSKTKTFEDMDFSKATKSAVGRRIYKIRNVLVHQQDFDDPSELNISSNYWPVIVEFLVTAVRRLYQENAGDSHFSYLLKD